MTSRPSFSERAPEPFVIVGPYTIFDAFASGGMASVHFGRLVEEGGVRVVAIKRLHPHLRDDPTVVLMLLDEAGLARGIEHRNVVRVLDVVSTERELLLVMEYVHGLSLRELERQEGTIPLEIATAIIVGVLRGLQAAHDAKGPSGLPLRLVHRDVSPQNVLIRSDGVAMLTDFGVAKAIGRLRSTNDGSIKGKIAYMSPEQVADATLDARSDVYAAAVVLWEMLVGKPLFEAENDVALFGKVLRGTTSRLSSILPSVPEGLDDLMTRALSRDPGRRPPSARAFADALEAICQPADERTVAEWVLSRASNVIASRYAAVQAIERMDDEPTMSISGEHGIVHAPSDPMLRRESRTSSVFEQTSHDGQERSAYGHRVTAIAFAVAMVFVLGMSVFLRAKGHASSSTPQLGEPNAEGQDVSRGLRPTDVAAVAAPAYGVGGLPDDSAPSPAPKVPMAVTGVTNDGSPTSLVNEVATGTALEAASLTAPPATSSAPALPDETTIGSASATNAKSSGSGRAAGAATAAAPKRPRAATAPAKRTQATRASCDPPVWFDSRGVKHFKPECL